MNTTPPTTHAAAAAALRGTDGALCLWTPTEELRQAVAAELTR